MADLNVWLVRIRLKIVGQVLDSEVRVFTRRVNYPCERVDTVKASGCEQLRRGLRPSRCNCGERTKAVRTR
jgi:hypothetical protein